RVRSNLSRCLKATTLIQALESSNRMPASRRSFFSPLGRDQNLPSLRIFHLQQSLVEQSAEKGESLLLARVGIDLVFRREVANEIRNSLWTPNCVPNFSRHVRDTIVVSGGNADHDEILIGFGRDYLRVALNGRIQCQHRRSAW